MQINSNHQLLENYTLGNQSLFINLSLGETLGRGTFGKVKLGTHKLTSEKVEYFMFQYFIVNLGCYQNPRKSQAC